MNQTASAANPFASHTEATYAKNSDEHADPFLMPDASTPGESALPTTTFASGETASDEPVVEEPLAGPGAISSDSAYSTHPLDADIERRMYLAPFGDRDLVTANWTWQFLPEGLYYKSYLAGAKESRLGGALLYDTNSERWLLDSTLGARVGIFRLGTPGPHSQSGWQLDVEGAAFPRLDIDNESDMESADFRIGVPLTWRHGPQQMKLAYYHISAHVGDEYLVRNPGFARINYVRDALVLGYGYFLTPDVRVYSEAGWSFNTDGGAEPWELQFGVEYSPLLVDWPRGAPFWAVNAHLFEEYDFGGYINAMLGWQWRTRTGGHLLRTGLQYLNGKSTQYQFVDNSEELVGIGLWYDF